MHSTCTELEVDRSFVAGLDKDATFTRVALSLASSLGQRSLAEGAETADQLAILHLLGADAAQGYNIARPMPDAGLTSWVASTRIPTHT